MSNGVYAFLAQDGCSYQATAADIQRWLGEGRILPDSFVTEVATGRQRLVREVVALEAPAAMHSPYYKPLPEGAVAGVDNHLLKALFSTICIGITPLGVVAIVYSTLVNRRLKYGDYAGARDASKKANAWGNWSIALGIVALIWMIWYGRTILDSVPIPNVDQ